MRNSQSRKMDYHRYHTIIVNVTLSVTTAECRYAAKERKKNTSHYGILTPPF